MSLGCSLAFRAISFPVAGSATTQTQVFVDTVLPFLWGQLTDFPELGSVVGSQHLLGFQGVTLVLVGTGRQVVVVLLLGL